MTTPGSMRPRRLRWKLGAPSALALIATLTLSGCGAVSIEQRLWESRVSAAPGVERANWNYYNGWPNFDSKYTAEIRISPKLSEAEAQEIAQLSCQGNPRFDDVYVDTASSFSNSMPNWEATLYGLAGACFNPEHLQDFTRVLGALGSGGPDLIGEVDARVFDPTDGDQGPFNEYTLSLTIETTSTQSLFTLLREVRTRTGATPLEIEAWVDGDGSTLTNFGIPVRATLPAGYDPARAFDILERAYDLPHQGLELSPEGISLTPGSMKMLSDPLTLELQAESIEAGIPFTLLPPQNSSGNQEENQAYSALLLELAESPGITGVQMPSSSGSDVTKVTASELDAIPEALRLIQSSEPAGAEFYVTDAADTMFVRVSRGAQQNPNTVEAFEQMVRAQAGIPKAGFAAIIVNKESISMRFDLTDAVTKSDVNNARAALLQLIEASTIDEVSLYPPAPFPSETLGAVS